MNCLQNLKEDSSSPLSNYMLQNLYQQLIMCLYLSVAHTKPLIYIHISLVLSI